MAFRILKNQSDITMPGNVREKGRIVTDSTTPNQLILSHRVRAGEILNVKAFAFKGRLAVYAPTPTVLGNWSIEVGVGNKILTQQATNESRILPHPFNYQVTEFFDEPPIYILQEPLPVPPNTVIRFVCTPSSTVNMVWVVKIVGDER